LSCCTFQAFVILSLSKDKNFTLPSGLVDPGSVLLDKVFAAKENKDYAKSANFEAKKIEKLAMAMFCALYVFIVK